MELLVILLIVLVAATIAFVGIGLSRRAQRRTARIARELGLPPAEPLPVEAEPPALLEPKPPALLEPKPPALLEPELPTRGRLRDRLGRTRAALGGRLGALRGRSRIDVDAWEELEEALIASDVGVATTTVVLERVRTQADAAHVTEPAELVKLLEAELVAILDVDDRSLRRNHGAPSVWLFVGVNGVGKTTTIAKLAQQEVACGHRVLLAAADTFRAAAADQLAEWAGRVGAEIVRGQEGADPGSVVYDAMSAAGGRGVDVVLVDTAGRLHTKVNLMNELTKLRRILDRTPGALTEVLLVVDATTGQNGLTQARQFTEAVDVTGVVLTKLDGTAKGGIVLAIQAEIGVPVKVVGVGETAADLLPFDPGDFVAALFE